jgi:hypothetical protein
VTLVATRMNTFAAGESSGAGIGCSSRSKVTSSAAAGGSCVVRGGRDAAGIGTRPDGMCGWVTVVNGSVDSSGGTGIGSQGNASGGLQGLKGWLFTGGTFGPRGSTGAVALEVEVRAAAVRPF